MPSANRQLHFSLSNLDVFIYFSYLKSLAIPPLLYPLMNSWAESRDTLWTRCAFHSTGGTPSSWGTTFFRKQTGILCYIIVFVSCLVLILRIRAPALFHYLTLNTMQFLEFWNVSWRLKEVDFGGEALYSGKRATGITHSLPINPE